MTRTLTSSAFHSLKWSYSSSIVIGVLQIALTAVLARLLEPKAFGLVAMGGVVLRFGSYFAQMGMGSALVQKETLTTEDIRLAFTLSTGLSLFFFLLFWLATPVATRFFDAPELSSLLPVMAFSLVLTGMSITSLALLRREFRFKLLAILEILAYVIGYGVVGVVSAMRGAGAWSLVYASLTQSAVSGMLAYGFTRHNFKPLFEPNRGRTLVSFGGKISLIGFLEFIGGNLDTMVIGRLLGAASLGLYNRAFMLVNVPMQYLANSLSRVLLPSFSRVQRDQDRIERSYRTAMIVLSSLLFPLCFGIAGAAREVVLAILGEKWTESIPILRVLALSTPFMLLSHIGAVLLEATAKLTIKFFIQIGNILLLCTLFIFLFPYGLLVLASAVLVSSMAIFVAYTVALDKLLALSQKRSYLSLSSGFFSGCVVLCVLLLFSNMVTPWKLNIMSAFALQVVLGGVVSYLMLVSPMQKALRVEILSRLSQLNIRPRIYNLVQRLFWQRSESVLT